MAGCNRCGKICKMYRGSYFNSDSLCEECVKKEDAHPLYPLAKKAFDEEEKGNHVNWDDFPELVEYWENDTAPEELYLNSCKKKKVKETIEEDDFDEADFYNMMPLPNKIVRIRTKGA
jgi:hypothetical protein